MGIGIEGKEETLVVGVINGALGFCDWLGFDTFGRFRAASYFKIINFFI